ncbi:MAG: YegS/Rv2252/BmrU family lipid kinase [Clostridiales bacterium]|nr:YegS/Rv2252/BmrU family lipid kinase [Clostridiales bacterium]
MANSNSRKKKVLLFYNPNSGSGMFKNNLDLIISKFQAKKTMVIPVRAGKGDMLEFALQDMDQQEYAKILIAGGDGTINICVNAMIRSGIDLPIAIFPSGTANDFAYYFDIPSEIGAMTDIALGNSFTYADVGKVNDKFFINVAAMGTLVDVSQKTDPDVKNTLGIISYYLKGITEVPNLKPTIVRLASDEYTGEENMYFMLIMNGRSAGGFKRISPNAVINDGLLDVMLFREMPLIDFAPLLISVLQGNHTENKNVLFFRTSKLKLESDVDISTDIDGEKGEKFPLTFEVLQKRLKVLTKFNDMPGAIW